MIATICLVTFLLTLIGICACFSAILSSRFTQELTEVGRLPRDFFE
jgi:hypothetical protein